MKRRNPAMMMKNGNEYDLESSCCSTKRTTTTTTSSKSLSHSLISPYYIVATAAAISARQEQHSSFNNDRQQDKNNNTGKSAVVVTNQTRNNNNNNNGNTNNKNKVWKQLFCGGVAGATAKTVTAPFSRLTILYQVHSMVTTKEHRPKFAMTFMGGFRKIIERGGLLSLWRGNLPSVLHRFPYSAMNFFVYENSLLLLRQASTKQRREKRQQEENNNVDDDDLPLKSSQLKRRLTMNTTTTTTLSSSQNDDDIQQKENVIETSSSSSAPWQKFLAGTMAGLVACIACYPLDLVRTRLTTELEGREHYRGMMDAFGKIHRSEGMIGFYSGLAPTLWVAVPNFAISYTIYGTLKEYVLEDDLFYNLRLVEHDDEDGGGRMGFILTLGCGACSGALSTLATFPMDTIRRRMQIQNVHIPPEARKSAWEQTKHLFQKEGAAAFYRGITPELIKVIPMVGTMFTVYEFTKDALGL